MIGRNLLPRRPGRRYERKTKRPGSRFRTRKPGAAEPQNPIRSAVVTIGQLLVLIAVAAGAAGVQPQLSLGYSTGGGHPLRTDLCTNPGYAESVDENAWRSEPKYRLIRPFLFITKSLEVHRESCGNGPPHGRSHLLLLILRND